MVLDKSKMLLTFKHPRVSRPKQEQMGRAFYGMVEPHVLHVGELPKLAIDAAKATREGDIVWVYALPMIVASRKLADVGQHAQITLFTETIHGNKATLVEGSTGRSTAKWRQRNAMIDEAHRVITHGGKRLPATGKPAGRPKKEWPTPQIEKEALRMWQSKNINGDKAAIREIMARWEDLRDDKGRPLVTERLIRALPKSGRKKR
jgi:hypothetical protein